eukprot:scaffold259_cov578-Prasinococcus_capsulatus_cf.AAC.6
MGDGPPRTCVLKANGKAGLSPCGAWCRSIPVSKPAHGSASWVHLVEQCDSNRKLTSGIGVLARRPHAAGAEEGVPETQWPPGA